MVEVLVEHDYVAKEPNELTITKGDIIKDVIRKQGGWWEGTLKDRKGLFPDNFVKVIDKDSSVVLRNRKDASRIRQCRVIFSYKQDHEDELNLNVGDIIDILGEEEEGWWRGILHGKEGVFPSNFVEEIVPINFPAKISSSRENIANSSVNNEPPPIHNKPAKILCEVKFPYKAQNEDELTLKEGDLVTLLSKEGQDPGWWKGELNGTIGVFPDNFVTVLQIPDESSKEDRRHKSHIEPVKPSTITSQQRKSLEPQHQINDKPDAENAAPKTTPPLPGKKPTIPIKKSPSSSGSSGIFYGLKKKIVDVVDGATGSKNISPPKTETGGDGSTENVFDDVHRRPLLADVRASRPKAPGRRPPSLIGKDAEPGIMNGNTEHPTMETLSETSFNSTASEESGDSKPKLREWEKHRAPWLEEMKLNQAKRVDVRPKVSNDVEKQPSVNHAPETVDPEPPKEPSPVDKAKSRIKTTPTNEFPVLRNKAPTPSRPQTIQNLSEMYGKGKASRTPSPMQKAATVDVEGVDRLHELEQRLARLEELVEQQQQRHEAAVEELRGKLQLETELRMKLQVKLERLTADATIQQL